jgi:site-specific DNA recombinase
MPALRGVFYGRKSNEDDGSSIDQQRAWALPACEKEGIVIVREFADQAKKGHETASRTDSHEMLKFCQDEARSGRPIETIVCWHPNRFSRADSQETAWFVWEFRKAGANLIFTASHGWRDFRKDTDRILFNLEQDTTNHRFVRDLAQACTRGRIDAAREGRPLSECPYGYLKEYEEVSVRGKKRRRPKRLIPGDPAEVEVVRWLFVTYATTLTSMRRLAMELNRRGVAPPKRGKAWSRQTVEVILKNPVYLGVPVWGRRQFGKFFRVADGLPTPAETRRTVKSDPAQWIRGEEGHEPLIERKTFDRVQRRLTENRGNRSPSGERARPLAGLLRCGCCKHAMVGRDNKHRSRKDGRLVVLRQYICSGYNTYGASVCGLNTISEEALLNLLLRKLQERFLDPAERQRLCDEIESRARGGQADRETEVQRLRTRVTELSGQIKQAARRLLTEDERLLPVLREQVREMQEEHDRLAQELAAIGSETPGAARAEFDELAERAVGLLERLTEVWQQAPPALLRDVLSEMVARVDLYFEHDVRGSRKRSRFVHGVIHPKGEEGRDYSHTNCSKKRLLNRSERLRSVSDPS